LCLTPTLLDLTVLLKLLSVPHRSPNKLTEQARAIWCARYCEQQQQQQPGKEAAAAAAGLGCATAGLLVMKGHREEMDGALALGGCH